MSILLSCPGLSSIILAETYSDLEFTTTGNYPWSRVYGTDSTYYYDGDSARSSNSHDNNYDSRMETVVQPTGTEKIEFWWKVSCRSGDYLEFRIDDVRQGSPISGNQDWDFKSFNVSAGTRTLKWRYIKDGSNANDQGADCGWVDFVQWTGHTSAPDPANWQNITYKHDVHGRRISKTVEALGFIWKNTL